MIRAGRLLDRQVGDLDHGAAEPAVHALGLLELLVDLEQLGVVALAAAEAPRPLLADLREPLRVDRDADDLHRVDLPERLRRLDPLHDRHVRGLVAEVAEVHRERRLRGARDADEHDVRVLEAAADAVVVLDGELDRRDPLEVRGRERLPRARGHPRRLPRDACDGVDRMAEQVAVVDARAAAERPHRLAQLGLHERVDDDGRPPSGAVHREREVVDGLDARVADLLELLLGELRLEREDEPDGGLAGRVRDHVQLDGRGHGHRVRVIGGRPRCGSGGCPPSLTPDPPGGARLRRRPNGVLTETIETSQFACGGDRNSPRSRAGCSRATFSDQRGICERSPSRPSVSRTSSRSRSRFARTRGSSAITSTSSKKRSSSGASSAPDASDARTLAVDRDLAQLLGQRALARPPARARDRPARPRPPSALPASRSARVVRRVDAVDSGALARRTSASAIARNAARARAPPRPAPRARTRRARRAGPRAAPRRSRGRRPRAGCASIARPPSSASRDSPIAARRSPYGSREPVGSLAEREATARVSSLSAAASTLPGSVAAAARRPRPGGTAPRSPSRPPPG